MNDGNFLFTLHCALYINSVVCLDNESKKMGLITVEVDPEKLSEHSVIFQGERRPLNYYQHAVKLCLDDQSLVKQRASSFI